MGKEGHHEWQKVKNKVKTFNIWTKGRECSQYKDKLKTKPKEDGDNNKISSLF